MPALAMNGVDVLEGAQLDRSETLVGASDEDRGIALTGRDQAHVLDRLDAAARRGPLRRGELRLIRPRLQGQRAEARVERLGKVECLDGVASAQITAVHTGGRR